MNRLTFCLIFSFLTALSCTQKSTDVLKNALVGSWNVEEVHWITPDTTYSITNAQPGIFMVTPKRYSIIWTPTQNARIPFKVLSNPTEEEIISGFRSIVFNTGTYTINDSIFNIEAKIAKVPGFEGGKQTFEYKFVDEHLELKMVDETYPNGDKPNWFGKLETLFIMTRID